MKHTPGPWISDETTVKSGRLTVAQAYDPENSLRTTDTGKANARLIAAAPDLLEGLKKILTLDESKGGIMQRIAGIAIKKAESEE